MGLGFSELHPNPSCATKPNPTDLDGSVVLLIVGVIVSPFVIPDDLGRHAKEADCNAARPETEVATLPVTVHTVLLTEFKNALDAGKKAQITARSTAITLPSQRLLVSENSLYLTTQRKRV
jgi:hypothetical protein